MLCLDVGFTMGNSASDEESSLEQAKRVMAKFVQRQVCMTLYVIKNC